MRPVGELLFDPVVRARGVGDIQPALVVEVRNDGAIDERRAGDALDREAGGHGSVGRKAEPGLRAWKHERDEDGQTTPLVSVAYRLVDFVDCIVTFLGRRLSPRGHSYAALVISSTASSLIRGASPPEPPTRFRLRQGYGETSPKRLRREGGLSLVRTVCEIASRLPRACWNR